MPRDHDLFTVFWMATLEDGSRIRWRAAKRENQIRIEMSVDLTGEGVWTYHKAHYVQPSLWPALVSLIINWDNTIERSAMFPPEFPEGFEQYYLAKGEYQVNARRSKDSKLRRSKKKLENAAD
jgi:hypothetical protein